MQAVNEFVDMLGMLDSGDKEIFDLCIEYAAKEEWEETPEIYQQFVDKAVEACGEAATQTARITLLSLLHEMATADYRLCDAAAPHIPAIIKRYLLNTDSTSIWDLVTLWKDNTALPAKVFTELKAIQKEEADRSAAGQSFISLTSETLKIFDAEANRQVSTTIEEEVQRIDDQATGKVLQWLKEGGDHVDEHPLTPVKPLPPTKWKVDPGAIGPFMDQLTGRITEALVDYPHLKEKIGEVLAQTTVVYGQVEKAKRLQDLGSALGALTSERVDAKKIDSATFEEFIKPMLACTPQGEATAAVDMKVDGASDAASASTEYDPLAAFTAADIHPDPVDMNPSTTFYLPQYTGKASSRVMPPSLGTAHILCRTHHLPAATWAKEPHSEPLRVLLVRKRKRID